MELAKMAGSTENVTHSHYQQIKCCFSAVQLQSHLIKTLSHGRMKPRGAGEDNTTRLLQKPDACLNLRKDKKSEQSLQSIIYKTCLWFLISFTLQHIQFLLRFRYMAYKNMWYLVCNSYSQKCFRLLVVPYNNTPSFSTSLLQLE